MYHIYLKKSKIYRQRSQKTKEAKNTKNEMKIPITGYKIENAVQHF